MIPLSEFCIDYLTKQSLKIITISDTVATEPPRIVPTATSQSAMTKAIRINKPDKGLSTKQV